MKARRAFFLTILIAVLVGVVLMLLAREPSYQGRTLTSWLEQIAGPPWDETQTQPAENAVRAIGAKKALPHLLRMAKAEDDPVSLWLIEKSKDLKLGFLKWHSSEELQRLAAAGFQALGTNAAPTVEELTKLLDKPDHAEMAAICLAGIGKPAEAALCQCLTNRNMLVRQGGMMALASVTDNMETYINRIKGLLKDPSEPIRDTAVYQLSAQTAEPELVVPLLISTLNDTSDIVSCGAAGGLADFGTNALVAYPILTNLAVHAPPNTANAALKTLSIIAPNESLPLLIQSATRGYPPGALRNLVDTSPDKALPIILTGTQSAQLDRRRWCFRLLSEYSTTPEIQSAMEHGVEDPDPIISQNAKKFLTEQYRKAHPIESQFTNEPAFQSKGLGEWVKMRRDPDGSFPDDAVEAIHHMGTNAIPGLLARLVYREPPFGLLSRVDGAVHVQAMCAFIVLGEQAIPALPQLRTLMDGTNGDIAVRAMMATCGTGSNAIPFFICGLTNQFSDVRNEAANYISQNFTNQFLGQREQLVPLFVKLLDDPDEFVRMNATNELKQIAPEVVGKAGIK